MNEVSSSVALEIRKKYDFVAFKNILKRYYDLLRFLKDALT